jgi:dihydroorotate dehydrogenase (NAD+) catalytic subunit
MTGEPFRELGLYTPWMNASGTLGFLPNQPWNWPEPQGGFVTNPVSLKPRSPAEGRVLVPFAGGFLMHTGLPNPGLSAVLRQSASRWARSKIPVWVQLLSNDPEELHRMVLALEEVEGVAAVVVGIHPLAERRQAFELVTAAVGELMVVVDFPLTLFNENWLEDLPAYGVSAVCLSAPRGTLLDEQGRLVSGRLYGPALLPLAYRSLSVARRAGLPVIVGAGVSRVEDGRGLLAAGAAAVQLDSVLWK